MINSCYTPVDNKDQQCALVYYLGKYSRVHWQDQSGQIHPHKSINEAFIMTQLLDDSIQRFWLARDPVPKASGGSNQFAPQSGLIVGALAFIIIAKHWAPKEEE